MNYLCLGVRLAMIFEIRSLLHLKISAADWASSVAHSSASSIFSSIDSHARPFRIGWAIADQSFFVQHCAEASYLPIVCVGDSLPDDYDYLPIRRIPTIIKRNRILPECADPLSGTCNLKQAMQPEKQFSDIAVSSLLQMRLDY
jgi:hypothetical protein